MQYSNQHVSTFKKTISTHNMECTLAGRKTSSKNLPGGPLVSEEFLVLPGDKDIDSYLDGNSDEPGEMGKSPWSMQKCLEEWGNMSLNVGYSNNEQPMFDCLCLYHPFMVIRRVVYNCYTNITCIFHRDTLYLVLCTVTSLFFL